MGDSVNLGIIGCGKVAQLHARAISRLEGVELSGVWSRTPKTAEVFAHQYDARSYSDISDMIRQGQIDLVIICTPHPFHAAAAMESASAGAHVLVEKPLAASLSDAREIMKSCQENRVKLGVISQRRWYEPAIRVKGAIERGAIGKPVLATVSLLGWRDEQYYQSDEWRGTWDMEGGGVLVNQAPHQLDLLLWYMGEIEEVYGSWHNLNHPYIEVDDTALAIVKFRNGGMGNIVLSNSQNPGIHGKVHIHGSNGASIGVQTEGGSMFIAGSSEIEQAPYNDLWTIPGDQAKLKGWVEKDREVFFQHNPTIEYIRRQIGDFVDAIRNKRSPSVTGVDGLRVVELFTAIYRSSKEHSPIAFPLPPDFTKT